MLSSIYEVLSLGARALFLILALTLTLRAAVYLLREHHTRKKILRSLPDAGMVGEMRDMDSDKAYPLPREGVLGGGRSCDIRLKGLRHRQVNFSFVEGKGVLLTPCTRRGDVQLNGEGLGRGAYALHGAILRVGGYTLRIRLFAGLNVPHPVSFQEVRQPVFEEELYAPDLSAFTLAEPVQPAAYPLPQEEQFFYSQRMPVIPPEMYAPVEQPPLQYTPAYEEAAEEEIAPLFDNTFAPPAEEEEPVIFETPVRHRRSDRRRNL